MVLMQQGGQLKDMFGGIGPAIKGVGGYVLGLITDSRGSQSDRINQPQHIPANTFNRGANTAEHILLMQQGGQLKDMFGGIGPAIKGVGGYVLGLINPVRVNDL
jgi:phage-related minor tail protein